MHYSKATLPIAPIEQSARMVPIAHIRPNPKQPRAHFPDEEIAELARSIRSYGIIQPLIVEEHGPNDYRIIAGERRFRAAQQAKITELPVICRKVDEKERLELALVENIQRAQLTVVEEAHAYRAILEQTTLTQEKLALRIGKARSTITNTIRILTLPQEVQTLLTTGKLSAGHARALLMNQSPTLQKRLARQIVAQKLSVRESEHLAQRRTSPPSTLTPAPSAKERLLRSEIVAVEERMRDQLITKVKIRGNDQQGTIQIHYHSLNDLNRLYKHICKIDD